MNSSKRYGITEFYEFGEAIQNTAIFSILICAPIGAILMDTLFPFLVTKDAEVVELEKPEVGYEYELADRSKQAACVAEEVIKSDVIQEGTIESV